jgi:voltage-gated potassium channel
MHIKRIVLAHETRAGRIFDTAIQILILVSVISFCIETLPNLSASTERLLNMSEKIIVAIFTAEYILRLSLSSRKLAFATSFYGLIDLFAILPFYIASGIDLRSLRIFRLLRSIRALKIMRYAQAIVRFQRAFSMIRAELVLFLVVSVFVLFFAAAGIYYFENPAQPDQFASVFHALWWAIVTLTGVGYGDIYPVTTGGKLFTSMILIVGLGTVAVPTGLIASSLSRVISEEAGYDER